MWLHYLSRVLNPPLMHACTYRYMCLALLISYFKYFICWSWVIFQSILDCYLASVLIVIQCILLIVLCVTVLCPESTNQILLTYNRQITVRHNRMYSNIAINYGTDRAFGDLGFKIKVEEYVCSYRRLHPCFKAYHALTCIMQDLMSVLKILLTKSY